MKHMFARTVGTALLVLLAGGISAQADTFTFTFDPLASGAPASGGVGATASIQNYMNSILGAGKSVVVTGAVADQTYNGDNHVVGPGTGSTSLTLGDSNGATDGTTSSPTGSIDTNVNGSVAYDTFIRNVSGTSSFTMTFSGLSISTISFDYEIFPDGTCPSLSNCGTNHSNLPDFIFSADGTQVFHYYGVVPGTATSTPGTALSTTSGWTSYSKSPLGTELAPQLLGTFSYTFATPVTSLTFMDWPATVAIDNLVVGTHAPEPSSLLLLATTVGLAGLGWKKRRKA